MEEGKGDKDRAIVCGRKKRRGKKEKDKEIKENSFT